MPRRYDRFWLHDTLGAHAGVHVWRASMGSDPARHTFYVRLTQMPAGLSARAGRQAARCKAARHPHLLQTYAWGEADGMGWVAAEHPVGYDVAALVRILRRQRLRIPLPLAVHAAMQALRALDWLHGQHLVHGAVHAGTVFLGPGNHVQLAAPAGDLPFGLHTLVQPAADVPSAEQDVRDVALFLQDLAAVPDVPVSLAWVLKRMRQPPSRKHPPWDAATLYRHLAACEMADAMAACAPLLRYWVQTGARAGDVARHAGAVPAWAQAPMQALFGRP